MTSEGTMARKAAVLPRTEKHSREIDHSIVEVSPLGNASSSRRVRRRNGRRDRKGAWQSFLGQKQDCSRTNEPPRIRSTCNTYRDHCSCCPDSIRKSTCSLSEERWAPAGRN